MLNVFYSISILRKACGITSTAMQKMTSRADIGPGGYLG